MSRIVVALSALLCLGTPFLGATDLLPYLVAELEVERELLAEDLRRFAVLRAEQKEALSLFAAATAAIDESIDARQVSLGGLESLEAEVSRRQDNLEATNRRVAVVRGQVYQRLRKTALLSSRIESLDEAPGIRTDPLNGRWRLSLAPGGEEGVLQLRFLNGTVSGFYSLDEGSGGSLRGTSEGGRLELERVDSRSGRDVVWAGEIDPVTRRIRGTWKSLNDDGDGPTEGSWSAEKIDGEKAEDETTQDDTTQDDTARSEIP